MGSGTTVVDVAKDVKLVDSQALDHITDGADEIISAACGYDRVNDDAYVGSLVVVAQTLVQQFLEDVGKVGRQ